MESYARRGWWLLLVLALACEEEKEVVEQPVQPAIRVEAAPPPDPGADRAKGAEEAKQRIEALARSIDPKLTAAALLESAESAYGQQHYKEARDAYRALVLLHPEHEKAPSAVNLSVLSSFRLGEYSDGLQFFEDAIHLFDGTVAEARLLRVLGNTYLSVPHWGVKKGGELIRARWDQGIYQDTHRLDRTLAIARLEEARSIYLDPMKASFREERIEAQFDLVAALARFTPYDRAWYQWYYAWPEAEGDDLVGEQAQRNLLYRAEPRGLPVDPSGEPIFESRPERYGGSSVQKMKFLLHEITEIDPTEERELAATALLRQALLFQTRDGPDRLQRYAGWWWNGAHPYQAAVEEKKLWELADDEVYGMIATHLGVYRPPEDENVLALFRRIIAEHPKTKAADQAAISVASYYQSRQQYGRALAEYGRYLERRPGGAHRGQAEGSIRELERAELTIHDGGVQLPGRPHMSIEHRNTTAIRGRARKLDMQKAVAHFKKQWMRESYRYVELDIEALQRYFTHHDERIDRFAIGGWKPFELTVTDDRTMRYAKTEVEIPIEEEGLWIVEVTPDEENAAHSRAMVLLQTTAVVAKLGAKGELLWVVDARSGVPIPNAQIEVFEYWTEWKSNGQKSVQRHRIQRARTDERGLATVGGLAGHTHLVSVRSGDRFAYSGNGYYWYYGPSSLERGDVGLVFTDRPVYRPENEVKMRVWSRRRRNGRYVDASANRITLRIHDPKGAKVFEEERPADRHGGADFSYSIPKGAPLGLYRMDVRADGAWLSSGGNQFRVEEYKAPELEVKVSAGDGPARLGEKIPIQISAHYYFGGAVEGARVRYQIFRTDHHPQLVPRGRWDWLYGEGYGLCWYAYPWFDWWHRWGPRPHVWYPWWGPRPEPKRELVEEGEGVLVGGALKVELDTKGIAETFGDADQRFVVKAEVRDASRRTITGEGEVIATRNQFFTTIETDRGYYQTGNTMKLTVRTSRPDRAPIGVEGELRIAKVLFTGDNLDVVEEKPVAGEKRSTDDFGILEHRWDVEEPGQYRVSFVAKDAWGGEVIGSTVVWVWGPSFEGRRFRFNHLEVVTDKRTYAVGETARLLISSDVADAYVLFSAKADNGALHDPQVLRLDGKTKLIEVPITESHVPNFFVDATLVGEGRISEEIREVFVPPTDAELKVEVKPAKKEHRPGEKARLEVVTTTLDGRPVSANVAVSVFDASVLYIQPSMTPDVRQWFWGQKRTHRSTSRSNLKRRFPNPHHLNRPDRNAISMLGSIAGGWLSHQMDFRQALDETAAVGGVGALAQSRAAADAPAEGRAEMAKAKAPAAAPAREAKREPQDGKKDQFAKDAERDADDTGAPSLATPEVRKSFADTAAWRVVTTNDAGRAEVEWTFPDNLTTWKVKAIGIGEGTRVGEANAETITTKKLLVRLQAPRFFRERDRVVISANVHNRLKTKKRVRVELAVTESLLVPEGAVSRSVEVESGGEARVDFWVNVRGEGEATVRVSALTDEESDAKELRFPVLVHGMLKTESQVGSITTKDEGTAEKSLTLRVPEERRPEQTELVVRWSPTLAGAMLDALPFLLEYPYGCTEQTTSRFVPAVITKKALQLSGGFTLEDLKKRTRSANPQQVDESKQAYEQRLANLYRRFERNPVYSQAAMDDMIAVGLDRLRKMQRPDGGWGWWGSDSSSIYTTAYVLWGLHEAQSADVAVQEDMIARGRSAMHNLVSGHLRYYRDHEWVSDTDAYFAYVMSLFGEKNEALNGFLMERRVRLSVYGKSLFALALWNLKDKEGANLLLRNAAQFLKEDPENETAWLETRSEGWWYWYNSDVESNATFLRALSTIRPNDDRAGKIVKWLLNHRQNGWYWRSTRDTAIVIASFAQYMRANRFDQTDYELDVLVDGKLAKSVHLDAKNLLTFDGELRLKGPELSSGEHTITFRRKGTGAVYFNSYLTYFTLEEDVPPAGLEIEVERKYFKLVRNDREHTIHGERGQAVKSKELAYEKVPLASGDRVESGDLILVELMLESKNDYEFLAFEDPKPAGAEPVALRSGRTYGEAVANMELRDDKVVFFLSRLNQGKLKLDYRLRAEIPGTFHAMPTYGFAMYSPELRANSSEMRLEIQE